MTETRGSAPVEAAESGDQVRHRTLSLGLDRFSGLYLWALFIVVFGLWEPGLFPTLATVHSVASGQSIVGMIALAVMVPLACGAYDLSVGATVNLSAILAISLQTADHWSIAQASAIAVGACVVVGVVNGFIVVKLGVNSFIATLGTTSVVAAVQSITSGDSQPLPPTSTTWQAIAGADVFGFQVVFVYLLVLALIVWWALEHTPAGRYVYAVGSNAEAARLAGIRVGAVTWWSLIASATICGVAGVLYGSLNGPSLTFGPTLLLPAFAAAFLGSTQLKRGRLNAWGTLIAVYVLATGVTGMQFATGVQWLSDMFNGVALIAAVAFAVWSSKRQGGVRSRRSVRSVGIGGSVGGTRVQE